MSRSKFLKLIQNQRDNKSREKFSGTFIDYLDLVKKDPAVAKLAHKRLKNAIENHGISHLD